MLIYKSKLRIVLTIAYITTGTINIRTTKEMILNIKILLGVSLYINL